MHKMTTVIGIALLSTVQLACADHKMPTSPLSPSASPSFAASASDIRVVSILDACDGPSFGAAGIDCSRTAGVKLDQFISELTANGSVGAWHFGPTNINVFVGQTLNAMNRGGETHTFTEVKHFGGGIVPLLNQLSGNPVPAPECLELAGSDFIPPGGTKSESVDDEGTELYQCCIHPWMRVMVSAKQHS